ncbi:hypothetical protein D3C87_1149960 [compost metagenome]
MDILKIGLRGWIEGPIRRSLYAAPADAIGHSAVKGVICVPKDREALVSGDMSAFYQRRQIGELDILIHIDELGFIAEVGEELQASEFDRFPAFFAGRQIAA